MPGARHPQAATAGDIRSRRSQGRRADHRRQIIDTDQRAVTQCNQGTQHRAQLPHIARPGERQQCLTRAGIERYRLLPGFLGQQKSSNCGLSLRSRNGGKPISRPLSR